MPPSNVKQNKLLFSSRRVRQFLERGEYTHRIGRAAPIALAAVLQYLTSELLGLSGEITKKFKGRRIQPRHLLLAIRMDDDLNNLLRDTTIANGGVLPQDI